MDLAYRRPEDEIAALRHDLAAARAQLGTAAVEIEHLRAQLAALPRRQCGQSSERLDGEIAQLELRLEDLEENQAEHQAARPDPASPGGQARPRAKAVRRPLPDHLPRETVVHEPEMVCGCGDRSRLARLGEDTTEILEKIPARLKVIRHVRPRYACRVCEAIFQVPAPDLPIERGRPGPGLILPLAFHRLRRRNLCQLRPCGGFEILRWPAAVPSIGRCCIRTTRRSARLPPAPARPGSRGSGSMPPIPDRMQERIRQRRSTAIRPTAKASGRANTWLGLVA